MQASIYFFFSCFYDNFDELICMHFTITKKKRKKTNKQKPQTKPKKNPKIQKTKHKQTSDCLKI